MLVGSIDDGHPVVDNATSLEELHFMLTVNEDFCGDTKATIPFDESLVIDFQVPNG
jgi:hypothetical protein